MMLTLLLAQGILDTVLHGSTRHELPPGSVNAEAVRAKPSWADPQGKMSGRSLPEDRKTYKDRRTISGENARRFFLFS